jgi:hypothetical protein
VKKDHVSLEKCKELINQSLPPLNKHHQNNLFHYLSGKREEYLNKNRSAFFRNIFRPSYFLSIILTVCFISLFVFFISSKTKLINTIVKAYDECGLSVSCWTKVWKEKNNYGMEITFYEDNNGIFGAEAQRLTKQNCKEIFTDMGGILVKEDIYTVEYSLPSTHKITCHEIFDELGEVWIVDYIELTGDEVELFNAKIFGKGLYIRDNVFSYNLYLHHPEYKDLDTFEEKLNQNNIYPIETSDENKYYKLTSGNKLELTSTGLLGIIDTNTEKMKPVTDQEFMDIITYLED